MKKLRLAARNHPWQDELERLVSRNISATRISFSYVEDEATAANLSLYGLLATIEQCVYGASDRQVSMAKLSWWLQELELACNGRGSHPLSGLLLSSGVLGAWPQQLLVKLIDLAMQRVNAQGLNTESELRSLCESMGKIHLHLESSINGLDVPDSPSIRSWAAMNGQMQLLRETFWSPRANFYWVPLTACARLSLERRDIAERVAMGVDHQLTEVFFSSIFEPDCPQFMVYPEEEEVPEGWARANRHWLIFSLLQQRQFRRISHWGFAGGPAIKDISGQLRKLRFTDGWAAWRLARQLA